MRIPSLRTRRLLSTFTALALGSCAHPVGFGGSGSGSAKVGPPNGSVMVVGGGALGPEIYAKFIELAGGPDALIIDVPTAAGDTVYGNDWTGARALRAAGAKNVVVLHTVDRKVADSDGFVAPIARAGGVWFDGGRQWHLVDSYLGTKTEREFHAVLARGGVAGGTSAGASILASYLLRGAREGNNIIMAPGYEQGFGFLRNVAIDQHAVARQRLLDLSDSLLPKHRELLGISEDEGTAWVIHGDAAEIIGRNKAFAYGGKATDHPASLFLTLRPGDRYDLAARRVTHRAIEDSPLTESFVDSLFAGTGSSQTTVLVAQDGRMLVNKAYNVPGRPRFMPATGANFPLDDLASSFRASSALMGDRGGAQLGPFMARRLLVPLGMHFTMPDADGRHLVSSVDELYRWDQGLYSNRELTLDSLRPAVGAGAAVSGAAAPPPTSRLGWSLDTYRGVPRQTMYGMAGGKRHAFVRFPTYRVAIIMLSQNVDADAKGIADRIADRLLFPNVTVRFATQQVPSTSACRSVSAVNAQVAWAGCTAGRVYRTVDGGTTWTADSVAGAATLDFRGIKAFDANTAVVTAAGPAERGQARIYRTTDGGRNWSLTWSDTTRGVFLDGLAFWDAQHGFTFSDPINGRLVIITTDDGGRHWVKMPPGSIPPVIAGEAAFAASNTQLTVQGSSNAWIATGGGSEARVFRSTDRGRTWTVATTGMPGGAAAGLFGIAFSDARNGLAIGGDYRIDRGVTDFALRTTDGGATWRSAGVRRPDGTTQGLSLVPGTNPPVFVAVGPRGVSFTGDFGASWVHSDTLTSWGVGFAGPTAGWVAGPRGRVAKFTGPSVTTVVGSGGNRE